MLLMRDILDGAGMDSTFDGDGVGVGSGAGALTGGGETPGDRVGRGLTGEWDKRPVHNDTA